MANPADKYARKTFSQLESQMSRMYREAYKDVSKKLQDFTRRHKAKDKQMQQDLKKGKITQEQYASWLRGQVFIGQQWQDAKASLDMSIKNVMSEAVHLTHQKSIDVFTDNANYTAYQIEKDHGFTGGINFTMYDRKTVSRLMLEDPELLPRRKDINGNKLEAWNTKVIANCVTQSILQGESIDELSKRIARDTCIDAGRSSLLYARTAMTSAQNAGRVERMKEAEEMGIKVQKQWMSTLDSRTRDSHRYMDGEIADIDEEFSNGLEYPGDPDGDPREVYNCRCTIIYHYPEYSDYSKMERTAYYEEGDPEYDPDHRNYEVVKGMNYEQWTNYKQDQIRQRYSGKVSVNNETTERQTVQGKDLSDTYLYDPDNSEFDFAIEDVIHEQGFDGLPRVMAEDEFNEAYTGEQPLLLRTFSAPDQETLDLYQDMLENGKWYVDCSNGGAQYGQGMYTAGVYGEKGDKKTSKKLEGALKEMDHYKIWNGRSGMVSKTNYMTLDPSARIVDYKTLIASPEYKEASKKFERTINNWVGNKAYDGLLKEIQSAGYLSSSDRITLAKMVEDIHIKQTKAFQSGKKVDVIKYGNVGELLKSRQLGYTGDLFDTSSWAKWRYSDSVKNYDKTPSWWGSFDSTIAERGRSQKGGFPGTFAASCGYDAINAAGHGASGSYTVVLNRTKLVIKR